MTSFCEDGNESAGSIKREKFLAHLRVLSSSREGLSKKFLELKPGLPTNPWTVTFLVAIRDPEWLCFETRVDVCDEVLTSWGGPPSCVRMARTLPVWTPSWTLGSLS
jgi:hypothetical protein